MLACAAPFHAADVLWFLISIPAWALMGQAIEWVRARLQMDGFKLFVVLAIFAVSLAWAITSHREDASACEARRCETSTHRARLIRGECVCVEVPK